MLNKILWLILLLVGNCLAASVLLPVATTTTLLHTPTQYTSSGAVLQQDGRLLGNFGNYAYNTIQDRAYKTYEPVLGHVLAPSPLMVVNYAYVH